MAHLAIGDPLTSDGHIRARLGNFATPGFAWVTLVVLAIGTGLMRGTEPLTGSWTIAVVLIGIIVVAASLTARVAAGSHEWVPVVVAAAVLLPSATRGVLASIGYGGIESLSSADIQYLRAADYLVRGGALGAFDARLALYPTSFTALVALSTATGLDAATLLEWSWLLSLPIMAIGTYLFARELSGNSPVGGLAAIVVASNPWFYAEPVYDGFNLVLLPIWSYLTVRRQRKSGGGRITLASLLLLTGIISSHLFASLVLVLVGFAVGASTAFGDSASDPLATRLTKAMDAGVRASLLPVVALTAWLLYIAARYFQEGVGLLDGFISALASTPFSPDTTGTTLLDPWQVVALVVAFLAYAGLALTTLLESLRTRHPAFFTSVGLALFAGPLVLWALLTPLEFAGGTDLKEWKVRPLHGAFLLVAPGIGMGMLAARRRLPGHRGAILVFLATGAVLVNSLSLWLFYGSPGGRAFDANAIPRSVEDSSITPGEYRALGEFVRRSISADRYLIADWHQVQWMSGPDGPHQVPDYLAAPFVSREALARILREGSYDGIAVDRNLLIFPSVYIEGQPSRTVMDTLDETSLHRVFDSGSQTLYVTAPFGS